MLFKEVELRNFRNHRWLRLEPSPGINLLIGPNASGKTNFLEGLYLLATGRPLRTQRDVELVTWGESSYFVRGVIQSHNSDYLVEIGFSTGIGKQIKVNSVKQGSLPDHITMVTFGPDDLAIIKGTPSERRRFIDSALAQIRPSYKYQLMRYSRVLSQRNNILRMLQEGRGKRELLEPWNAQLVRFGSWIWKRRIDYVRNMEGPLSSYYEKLSGCPLVIRYKMGGFGDDGALSGIEISEDRFSKLLFDVSREEIKRGVSLVGPQRDDLAFLSQRNDIRLFGSQGQQRMAVLALKLGELSLLRGVSDDEPVLLLDDVFSELDAGKRSLLWESVSKAQQVFMTGTDLSFIPASCRGEHAVFRVSADGIGRWEDWRKN